MAAVTKIIDLDAIVPGRFVLKVGGKEYNLPKSVSTDTAFHMMKLFKELNPGPSADGTPSPAGMADPDKINEIFMLCGSVVQEHYPEVSPEAFRKQMSLQQAYRMLGDFVKEIFEMDEEGNEGNS